MHDVVIKPRPAINSNDLAAYPIHQAAAERHDDVGNLLRRYEQPLHVKAVREFLKVATDGGPERLSAHEPRAHDVDSDILTDEAILHIAA